MTGMTMDTVNQDKHREIGNPGDDGHARPAEAVLQARQGNHLEGDTQ
jgi:hypothetical protein